MSDNQHLPKPATSADRRRAAQNLYALLYKDALNVYRRPHLYQQRFKEGVLGDIQAEWWESVVDRVQY